MNASRRSACRPSGVTTPTLTAVSLPAATARTATPTSAPDGRPAASAEPGRRPRRLPGPGPHPSAASEDAARPAAQQRDQGAARPGLDRRQGPAARRRAPRPIAPAQLTSPRAHTNSPSSAMTTASASSTRSRADRSPLAMRPRSGRRPPPVARRSRPSGWWPRSSGSPSCSATCDSPIPVSRSVRTSVSTPTPRAASLGSTSSDHIGRISRGGPGSVTITRPSGRSTHQPGAVPLGFGGSSPTGWSTPACG